MSKITDDAAVAAEYFKALLSTGIDPNHAVMLTAQYVTGRLIAEKNNENPPEPWQQG